MQGVRNTWGEPVLGASSPEPGGMHWCQRPQERREGLLFTRSCTLVAKHSPQADVSSTGQ